MNDAGHFIAKYLTKRTVRCHPCRAGAGTAIIARDQAGSDVQAAQWLASHPYSAGHSLVQGLKVRQVHQNSFQGLLAAGMVMAEGACRPLSSALPVTSQAVDCLQGDPTYLIVTEDGGLDSYGLNSICTHLGCVVPWNNAEHKFMCPCHGSQYDPTGAVVRGPAPLVSPATARAAADHSHELPWGCLSPRHARLAAPGPPARLRCRWQGPTDALGRDRLPHRSQAMVDVTWRTDHGAFGTVNPIPCP